MLISDVTWAKLAMGHGDVGRVYQWLAQGMRDTWESVDQKSCANSLC